MATGKHSSPWTRVLRRYFRPFLDDAQKKAIAKVIADVERRTTGEIHVHLMGKAGPDILIAAKEMFEKLELHKTSGRNGVLILISHLDHRFAIWGDGAVHAAGGHTLWKRALAALHQDFKERRYPEGITACVREVGVELARHFPRVDAGPSKNQLSNDVTEND